MPCNRIISTIELVIQGANLGKVWNQGDNPNELPDENFIAAIGVGLIWQPLDGLNLQLQYAPL